MRNGRAALADRLDRLVLVDHHVHGTFRTDGDESRFGNALNEGDTAPLADLRTAYDSQLGFALRRWCAGPLGLPEHVGTADYWRRRAELGETEVSRRLLGAAGVDHWLVDTGFRSDEITTPAELAGLAGGTAHEVVRLEAVAESVLAGLDLGREAGDYVARFRAELDHRLAGAVATKSVLAYRGGFDRDLARPDGATVTAAVRELSSGAAARLTDTTVIAFGIHEALDRGLPLQLHVGFGDRDLDLRRANPLLLTDFLRRLGGDAVIMLLHCWPYEREAGYLAQAFGPVHLDVGLALNYVGARAEAVLARALELAPFGKVLYSSDACGPAELHHLGAKLWRTAAARLFGGWVESGDWSLDDAVRVATMIGRENALRAYRLPPD